VRNVDVSSLSAYQRASAAAFWTSPVLLSIAHGEGVSPQLEEGFYHAVSDYVSTRSAAAFASQLENAVYGGRIPQR
jgi:glucose/mannose transport system substrate-binding protein